MNEGVNTAFSKRLAPFPGQPGIAIGCVVALVTGLLSVHRWAPNASRQTPASDNAQPRPSVTNEVAPLPRLLSGTGLYRAGSTTEIAPEILTYSPQYPLWSDGATKRRFIAIPPGTSIDATDPDHWQFPIGTRFWKEFSFGERTETRYIERLRDGSFRYASYVWDAALGDARLAPREGVPGARAIAEGASHDIPSEADCRACHEGRRSPVLGFNALQLSPDRDPFAAHREAAPPGAVDLAELVRRDLVRGLPRDIVARAPRIAAPSPTARAAAGYLFGNCAGCHNTEGPLAALGLDFDQSATASDGYARLNASVTDRPSRFRVPSDAHSLRAKPGSAAHSTLWFRMQSRSAAAQMPPLGSKLVDRDGIRLIERWIANDLRVSPVRHSSTHQP